MLTTCDSLTDAISDWMLTVRARVLSFFLVDGCAHSSSFCVFDFTVRRSYAISSQLRHISIIGKKLLSSNISSTCLYNMVNFGPLPAEIVSLVWSTPANFNGFRVLAALLHGTPVMGRQPNFAALNRGRHLYSTGRPSRWHWPTFLVIGFMQPTGVKHPWL